MKIELLRAGYPTPDGKVYTKESLRSALKNPSTVINLDSNLIVADCLNKPIYRFNRLELSDDGMILYAHIDLVNFH